jgi:hypothetical protein
VSEEVERLLREFLDNVRLLERVAKLEAQTAERARLEDRDFRTQSGSWDVNAILALERSKKKTSVPPPFRALSTMMDSAGGKVGALVAAALVPWLLEHLPALVHALTH